MQLCLPETPMTDPREKHLRYCIVNHDEAGLFDSMTGATIWALKNLKDWEWRIEPVARNRTEPAKFPTFPDEKAR